jgi:TniQ
MNSQLRSLLYGQQLLGVGTGHVESLRSYIQRLARSHNVMPTALVRLLLDKDPIAGFNFRRYDFARGNLHGTDPVPSGVLSRFQAATAIQLSCATMGRFGQLICGIGATRMGFARYCPLCVRNHGADALPYGQLVWEVTAVSACPIHHVRLRAEDACDTPPEGILPIHNRPRYPGVCTRCGSIGHKCSGVAEAAGHAEIWIAQQVAALLSLSDATTSELTAGCLHRGLIAVVTGAFNGEPVTAAKAARLGRGTLIAWLKHGGRPTFGPLVSLCLAARADLVSMFRGEFRLSPDAPLRQLETPSGIARRRHFQHNWREIHDALLSGLSDESLVTVNSIATRFRVEFRHMRLRFPFEVTALVEKSARFREEAKGRRYEDALAAYSAGADALVSRGVKVRSRYLQKESGLWLFSGQPWKTRAAALREVMARYQVGSMPKTAS